MRSRGLSAALVSGLALLDTTSANLVHITSYTGQLNTLNLTSLSTTDIGGPGQVFLTRSEVTSECGSNPSWLTQLNDILFCVNENFSGGPGNLAAFRILPEGGVSFLSNTTTLGGPVHATLFGNNKGLALANYGTSALQTFNITNPQSVVLVQNSTFDGKGPNAGRQEKSHPHQVITDPTGNFLIVPDLGTDLIRVFRINQATLGYATVGSLQSAPGSGPRHAAFVTTPFNTTYLYVVHELTNTLVGYQVTYRVNSTLGFQQVYSTTTYGKDDNGNDIPAASSAGAGEIQASPDMKFITLSNRNEGKSSTENPDPNNSTALPSDTLVSFAVNQTTGLLTHLQTRAAGGLHPRHFSFNRDGTLVGVSLKDSARAVLIERNPESGQMLDIVAHVEDLGEPSNFLFIEN
ncbi:hypothetical protein OQA88_12895 [Cercophora sp. LCS_1]